MYFYKNSDGTVLAQSNLPISRYIEITEEEYNQILAEQQALALEEEREQKEKLMRELMAELYPAE